MAVADSYYCKLYLVQPRYLPPCLHWNILSACKCQNGNMIIMKLNTSSWKPTSSSCARASQYITDTSTSSSLKSQALDQLRVFTWTKIHAFRQLSCVRNNPHSPGFLPLVSIKGSILLFELHYLVFLEAAPSHLSAGALCPLCENTSAVEKGLLI